MDRAELETFYRRYLGRCNEHRFDQIGEFVDADVQVNDQAWGVAKYIEGQQAVIEVFPDFHWDLRKLLVDGHWLVARLIDTGTTRDGRRVTTQEFAIYDVSGGRIRAVWGDLDHERLAAG